MANFLQQLPALLGVLVGAVATIVATSYAERSQWKRNQTVRWDVNRLEAYAQYAETIKHLHLLATRMSVPRRPGARSQPLERATGEDLISEGEASRARAWESVLMLADADTVAAGREWRAAVLRLELFARGLDHGSSGWDELDLLADRARERFYLAARQSLGVGGAVPLIVRPRTGSGERAARPDTLGLSPRLDG